MAKKRGAVDTTNAATDPAAEVTQMAEDTTTATTDDTTADETESPVLPTATNGTDPYGGRETLDVLDATFPSAELKARYDDDTRAILRRFFAEGRISRERRAIEIKGNKNPTGVDQLQPYWGYY